jgi:hypothetical protein
MTQREILFQKIDRWLAIPDKQAIDIILAVALTFPPKTVPTIIS